MKTWIETLNRHRLDPFNPDPLAIDIRDIATGLANTCRFSGQIPEHYSVAQHSIIMSYKVKPELALEALMHDAAEAYLGDVPRPVKYGLPDYRRISEIVERAIADKFHLVYPWHPDIHEADIRMVLTEAKSFGKETLDWGIVGVAYGLTIYPETPRECADKFLQRFAELYDERIKAGQSVDEILAGSDD